MFHDRYDAGMLLAKALSKYKGKRNVIILAIPRGALQIGEVLHKELRAPLDIIVTKKIPHPDSDEYGIGAVGPGGEYFINPEAIGNIAPEYIDREKKRIMALVDEKYLKYRGDMPKPDLKGKTVIIVDDGIATGCTMIAAIHVIRKQKPRKIVVAVPVGPTDSIRKVEEEADEVVCLSMPLMFFAIGSFYDDFSQVEDDEAIAILARCRKK